MVAEDSGDGSACRGGVNASGLEAKLRLGAIRDFATACREMIDLVQRQIASEDRRTADDIASADLFAGSASSAQRAVRRR